MTKIHLLVILAKTLQAVILPKHVGIYNIAKKSWPFSSDDFRNFDESHKCLYAAFGLR